MKNAKPEMKRFGRNASLMLSAIFILLAPVIGPISLFVGIFLFYLSIIAFTYDYYKVFKHKDSSIYKLKSSETAKLSVFIFLGALSIFTPAFMPLFLPDIAPVLILAGSIASIGILGVVTVLYFKFLLRLLKHFKIFYIRNNGEHKKIKIQHKKIIILGGLLFIGSISAIIMFVGLIVNPDISLFLSGGVFFPIAALMITITITGLCACIFAFLKFSGMISENKKSLAENKKSLAKANKQLMFLKFITLILGIAILAAGNLAVKAIFTPELLAAAIIPTSIVAGSLGVIVLFILLYYKFGPKKTAIGLAALAALASLGVSIQSLISAAPLVPEIAAISIQAGLVFLVLALLVKYNSKYDNKYKQYLKKTVPSYFILFLSVTLILLSSVLGQAAFTTGIVGIIMVSIYMFFKVYPIIYRQVKGQLNHNYSKRQYVGVLFLSLAAIGAVVASLVGVLPMIVPAILFALIAISSAVMVGILIDKFYVVKNSPSEKPIASIAFLLTISFISTSLFALFALNTDISLLYTSAAFPVVSSIIGTIAFLFLLFAAYTSYNKFEHNKLATLLITFVMIITFGANMASMILANITFITPVIISILSTIGFIVLVVVLKLLSNKFGPKKTAIGVALVLAALAALASLGVSIQSLISASPLVPGIAAISTISALVVLGLTLLTNYLLAKKQDNKLTTVGTIISFLSFVAIGLGIVSKLAPVAFLSEALFLGLIVGGISLIITSALIYIFRNELQEYGMSILGVVGLLASFPTLALLVINADVFAADLQLPFVQENLAIFISALVVGIVLIIGYFAKDYYKNSKGDNASVVGGAVAAPVPGAAAPAAAPAAVPGEPAAGARARAEPPGAPS